MPSCIKEKIVLPDPLTEVEVEETLRELEYALLYRLVTTDRPPVEMRHFVIRRGRVVFTVEKEFSVVLTVMGDDKSMPFRVLDINILVKHRRIGEGRALVHPQQISYLKQVVQSRIMDVENPLEEVSSQLRFWSVSNNLMDICNVYYFFGDLAFKNLEKITNSKRIGISSTI